MIFFPVLAFWMLLLLAAVAYYKLKKPGLLSDHKPKLTFFPKYQLAIALPGSILNAPDRLLQLEACMETAGFHEVTRNDVRVVYSRGNWFGDFSTQYAKIDVVFSQPLQLSTHLEVRYGAFALFDTGALWLFCKQLPELFNAADSKMGAIDR